MPDPRSIVRMSPHGYPIYEQNWNQAIKDCLDTEGLDESLNRFTREEVIHHLGGEAYGAKIDVDEVISCRHFDNPLQIPWSALSDVLAIANALIIDEIWFTHSKKNLLVAHKRHRLDLSAEMWGYYKKMQSLGNYHKNVQALDSDVNYTPAERAAIKARLVEMDVTIAQLYIDGVGIREILESIGLLGFVER